MPFNWIIRKAVHGLAGAAVAFSVLAGAPGRADAQDAAQAADSVSGDAKGVVGGALLGGEVVMLSLGAFGVERAWPYLVFGGVGAVAGGLAGYLVESTDPSPEVPLFMLAGGMALVIPTFIVTLNATAYKPPATDQNEPLRNEPAAEPPLPSADVRLGLVDITPSRLAVGVPALSIRPLYSESERFKFGVAQGQELQLPVVRATF